MALFNLFLFIAVIEWTQLNCSASPETLTACLQSVRLKAKSPRGWCIFSFTCIMIVKGPKNPLRKYGQLVISNKDHAVPFRAGHMRQLLRHTETGKIVVCHVHINIFSYFFTCHRSLKYVVAVASAIEKQKSNVSKRINLNRKSECITKENEKIRMGIQYE